MKRLKAIKIALIIFAACFVIHQVYATFYSSVTTSAALYYEMSDGLDVSVMVVRDEHIIHKNTQGGVAHYLYNDGEKVAAGGVVAEFYPDAVSSLSLTEIERLKEQLAEVKSNTNYNNVSAVDIDVYNDKVDSALYDLQSALADGNFSDCDEKMNYLLSAVNRRKVATGEAADFGEVEKSLTSQIAALQAKVQEPVGSVSADVSGYFVSLRDGYENVLNTEMLLGLTPEILNSIKPESTDGGDYIGKIVSDYNVYFAVILPFDKSKQIKVGNSYKFLTELSSATELKCTLERVSEPDDSRNVVAVFSCSDMNSELATLRIAPMKLVTKEYKGLKINSKALRVSDGKTGVYVVSGMQAKFVETNVIYNGDSFIICELQNEDTGRLRLYDEVIEKGSKLYDGKIID